MSISGFIILQQNEEKKKQMQGRRVSWIMMRIIKRKVSITISFSQT